MALHIGLWVAQALLTLMFLMSGGMKLTQPFEVVAVIIPNVPLGFIRIIGLVEIFGALGLMLSSVSKIRPNISIWAAIGITILMVSAFVYHLSRDEIQKTGIPVLLLLMAIFVVWDRSKKAPIQPKSTVNNPYF